MNSLRFDLEFDIVIVGGGSAGCVAAARLSESRETSVCLVEAGARDRGFWIRAPFGFCRLVADPRVNWGLETEDEPCLGGRRIAWPRGKVLGGSGSINGLVFLRGLPSDFDEWQRRGACGWSYEDVLPYFKRSERTAAGADRWRGRGGPLTVSDIRRPSRLARAFVQSCERLGYRRSSDLNGGACEGVGLSQLNVRRGWRSSPSTAYLRPAARRPNLALMLETAARRLLFDGRTAIGVEVERAGRPLRIGARAEILLCAGAVHSPALLLASGVGPAAELRALGAAVIHDLPGVGKGLQDHFLIPLKFRTDAPGTLNEIVRKPLPMAREALRWLMTASGQFAVGGTEGVLFAKSRAGEPLPDVQFQCANFSNESFESGLHPWPGFMSCFYACRPESRGEITLREPTGRSPPRIRANYLAHPEDLRVTLGGYRIASRLFATEPLRSLITQRLGPAEDCPSDEEAQAHARSAGTTGNHPCGTARMGVDELAVVDPQLRVRGLRRLRVIDASVMPTIPSSNIHAATIMIAEKGSALVACSSRR